MFGEPKGEALKLLGNRIGLSSETLRKVKKIQESQFATHLHKAFLLKGEMSIVGPRPCLLYEWECYSNWHKKRLHAIPGCTGLWQVVGRSIVTFEEMVLLDLYYISNMSIWFDFKIIIKTFPVIFLGKGGF